ncbi:hypothetical protein PMAYCL1PPCAC_22262, partial [Pristionchus mayeri]
SLALLICALLCCVVAQFIGSGVPSYGLKYNGHDRVKRNGYLLNGVWIETPSSTPYRCFGTLCIGGSSPVAARLIQDMQRRNGPGYLSYSG